MLKKIVVITQAALGLGLLAGLLIRRSSRISLRYPIKVSGITMRHGSVGYILAFFLSIPLSISLVNAGSSEHIKLSDSFAIEMPTDLQAHMGFMPSSSGFWFDGKYGEHKVSIWVQRVVPKVVANSHSVKRFWQDGIAQASKIGESSEDKGCQALEKYIFSCERRAHAKEERFASETLIWNAKSDLVVVRVMSDQSYEEAEAVAKMIQLKPTARLPASVKAK